MKNLHDKLALSAVIVLIVSMILSIVSVYRNSFDKAKTNREIHMRAATQVVDNSITKAFLRPITVAKVMSEDVNLREYMQTAGDDPTAVEDEVKDYLVSIKDGLGYREMFAVCDRSGAYFTCDGLTSFIDKSYQGNSQWYGELMSSGKKWELNVDIEESTGWALSIFVNQLIYDENKNVLGVCGTGVEMTQLQSLFELYERIYDIKIDVTDETGLIQIDTDTSKIEKDRISLPDLDKISDGEYYYERLDEGDRVITYMDDIEMYLVVTNTRNEVQDLMPNIAMPIIFSVIGILAAVALLAAARKVGGEKG